METEKLPNETVNEETSNPVTEEVSTEPETTKECPDTILDPPNEDVDEEKVLSKKELKKLKKEEKLKKQRVANIVKYIFSLIIIFGTLAVTFQGGRFCGQFEMLNKRLSQEYDAGYRWMKPDANNHDSNEISTPPGDVYVFPYPHDFNEAPRQHEIKPDEHHELKPDTHHEIRPDDNQEIVPDDRYDDPEMNPGFEPNEQIEQFEPIQEEGRHEGSSIGIRGTPAYTEDNEPYGNMPCGVYLVDVFTDCAADKAGLKAGDIIFSIDSIQVTTVEELRDYLSKKHAGDEVVIGYYRPTDDYKYQDYSTTVILDEAINFK